eukprot:COSAG06_NODE_820_length_12102_cov_16.846205_14_plen_87_part_00
MKHVHFPATAKPTPAPHRSGSQHASSSRRRRWTAAAAVGGGGGGGGGAVAAASSCAAVAALRWLRWDFLNLYTVRCSKAYMGEIQT